MLLNIHITAKYAVPNFTIGLGLILPFSDIGAETKIYLFNKKFTVYNQQALIERQSFAQKIQPS